jgi:AcrR family transcriptional regulator
MLVPAKLTDDEAAARRLEILDAVGPVFASRGYAGTTVGDLEGATGLSRGGIFFHFGQKRRLYLETIRRAFERFALAVAQVELPRGSTEEMLVGSYDVMSGVRATHPDFFQLMNQMVAQRETEPDLAELHAELDAAEYRYYGQLIAMRQAEGSLNPALDAEAIAHAFGGFFEELAEYELNHTHAETRALAERMFAVLARGIEPRAG